MKLDVPIEQNAETEHARREFVKNRSRSLGGSDSPCILQIEGAFKTPLEIWMEKTGRVNTLNEEECEYLYWGHVMEPIIAAVYAQRTGNRVRRINKMHFHPKFGFIAGNVDRSVINPDVVDRGILECKNVTAWKAYLWKGGNIPEVAIVQNQHYLGVYQRSWGDVAGLIGGNQLLVHGVAANPKFQEYLFEKLDEFWNKHVVPDIPPPAVPGEADLKALTLLYGEPVKDKIVELPANIFSGVYDEYKNVKSEKSKIDKMSRELDKRRKALETQIAEAVGDAEMGQIVGTEKYFNWVPGARKAYTVAAKKTRTMKIVDQTPAGTDSDGKVD